MRNILRNKPSLVTIFLFAMMGVTFLTNMTFAYFWISHEYQRFEQESATLREKFLSSQQAMLQQEVERALQYIQYSQARTENRLKQTIRNRVYEAHAIASHLYEEYAGTKDDVAIQTIIKDALRPVRFNQDRGYYFATNLNGIEELFADQPHLEGENLLTMKDTRGRYVIQDMIALVKQSGEGFYHYTWTKPNAAGRDFPKIAFIKHFEPYDWLIGTGEYLDDVESDIQHEVLERLIEVRFGNEGYLFGSTYAGDPLFTNGKMTVGTGNLLDLTDPHGVKIFQEYQKAVGQTAGGFVRYSWQKLTQAELSPKISFVKGFSQWQWIIGAGVYLDEIEQVIAQKRAALAQQITGHVLKIQILFLGMLCGIFVIVIYVSRKLKKSFGTFSAFFATAATRTTPITDHSVHFSEFEMLAASANQMISAQKRIESQRRQASDKLRQSERQYRRLNAELEERVSQRTAELELANKELNDFVYVASHDLKTPLRGISQLAYWFAQDYGHLLDQQGQEFLTLLIARVKKLYRLIDGMLEYASIGRVAEKDDDVSLHEVVDEILKTLSLPEHVQVVIEQPLPHVNGKQPQFEQVFRHLFDNAIAAVGEKGSIRVGCADQDTHWKFWVTDSGPGIEARYYEKIFQIFQTVSLSNTSKGRAYWFGPGPCQKNYRGPWRNNLGGVATRGRKYVLFYVTQATSECC
jgi:signal transduction histidine kinase/nitrogen-specific signal transduction histidine kinase